MEDKLLQFIKYLKFDKRISSFDVALIKQAVVLPILAHLDWNPFNVNEVYPEYSSNDQQVDFSLRHKNSNKVFLKVIKIEENFNLYKKSLLKFALEESVEIAVLTNGIVWQFYLPTSENNLESIKFYSLDIYSNSNNELTKKFIDFLSKDNIISGKALENLKNSYQAKINPDLIKEVLPIAWGSLVEKSERIIVDLIAKTVEKFSGQKPDDNLIEEYLRSYIVELLSKNIKEISGYEIDNELVENALRSYIDNNEYEDYEDEELLELSDEEIFRNDEFKEKKEISIEQEERRHLDKANNEIKQAYLELKDSLLSINENLVFNTTSSYISIMNKKNIAYLLFRKKSIRLIILLPEEVVKYRITNYQVKHMSERSQEFWNGPCCEIIIDNKNHLDEIVELFKLLI